MFRYNFNLRNLLKDVRDVSILTLSVFLLYGALWYVIVDDPDFFSDPYILEYEVFNLLFCVGFCVVSFILSLKIGKIAKNGMHSVNAKMGLLTVGILLVNCIWAWVYSVFVDIVVSHIDDVSSEPYTDKIDIYGLAFISTLVLSLMLTARYVKAYIEEKEQKEREKDIAREVTIRNLQLQLSPHFLFNNLSALSALVGIDTDKAEEFIMHLSQFYRYTLQNIPNKLIPVEDELSQLKCYLFLIKTRFDESIDVKITTDNLKANSQIPPGSLQLLVENCIKHNRFSKSEPLCVDILCSDDRITVRNDYRPRKDMEMSFSIGHENIKERYRLMNSPEIKIEKSESVYSVTIPLIKQDEDTYNRG